jgi:hypothetical protein
MSEVEREEIAICGDESACVRRRENDRHGGDNGNWSEAREIIEKETKRKKERERERERD